MRKYYKESRRREISYIQKREERMRWIFHILGRNCLLKDIIKKMMERGIEVTGRRGKRRKQLLDTVNETKE
jgi:hypothetical protein